MERLLSLVDSRAVSTVIIAKLDRLTRSVKDLAELLERFTAAVFLLSAWPIPWTPVPPRAGWC